MGDRYNEPLYNEVLGITNDFLYPVIVKYIHGKELRHSTSFVRKMKQNMILEIDLAKVYH